MRNNLPPGNKIYDRGMATELNEVNRKLSGLIGMKEAVYSLDSVEKK